MKITSSDVSLLQQILSLDIYNMDVPKKCSRKRMQLLKSVFVSLFLQTAFKHVVSFYHHSMSSKVFTKRFLFPQLAALGLHIYICATELPKNKNLRKKFRLKKGRFPPFLICCNLVRIQSMVKNLTNSSRHFKFQFLNLCIIIMPFCAFFMRIFVLLFSCLILRYRSSSYENKYCIIVVIFECVTEKPIHGREG